MRYNGTTLVIAGNRSTNDRGALLSSWCGRLFAGRLTSLFRAVTLVTLLVSITCPTLGQQALHFEHLSVEDGLTDNQVNDFVQDRFGFLWIATAHGLNRFDGQSIRGYTHDSRVAGSLPHNDVRALALDEQGRLWAGTRGGGIVRYEVGEDRFTVFRGRKDDPRALTSDFVECLAADGRGGLWIGMRSDGVARLDFASGVVERFMPDKEAPGALRAGRIGAVRVTRDGTVWIGGMGHGLYRRKENGAFRQYLPIEGDASSLPDRRITTIHEDATGRVWIGTYRGLALWNPETDSFRVWKSGTGPNDLASDLVKDVADAHGGKLWVSIPGVGLQLFDPAGGPGLLQKPQPTRRNSLADAATNSLLVDRTDVLWIGTALGASRLDPATLAFQSFATDPDHLDRFPDDDLWGIGETADGAIWIGTASMGVARFDPATGSWKNWRHDPNVPDSLASDEVFALLVDSAGRVWVGTSDAGLDLYDPARDAWTHHRHDPKNPDTISQNGIFALRESRDGRGLWIGLNRGFDRLDFETGVFAHPAIIKDDPDGGLLATVFDLVEDPSGTVWIGTFLNGLYELDVETQTFEKYRPEKGNPASISSYRINVLMMSRDGILWAGTNLGLFRHEGSGNRWREYGREDGLSTENIASLHEAEDGTIWIGTSNGLNRLTPATGEIRRFFSKDGLPNSEIAWHALGSTRDGRIAIGTARGFSLLDPKALRPDPHPPQVVLTGLELFNRRVPLAHELTGPLPPEMLALDRPIALTDSITLDHRQNVFSLGFTGLHFARPELVRYAYQLEGWDREWLETPASRPRATYTNLPGGRYTFRVRASNRDGVWSEPTSGLAIVVKPPPWKSPVAYAIYVVALVSAIAAMMLALHRRAEEQRLRAEREAAISERLRRVDQLRDEFLANTSHELRTPLHGIIGIAESLVDGAAGPLPDAANRNLSLVVSSGKRLASLINDVLDFSTLRNDTLSLSRKATDLRPLVDVVLTLSAPLVLAKPVELVNRVPRDLPMADADEGRVQQILHNLVGNAVKFTRRGSVTVGASAADGWLTISVTDTGIGIAREDQERIFESFEQAEGGTTREFGGTGLGLTLAKQLVELHGGSLGVESAPGEGSTFRFTLPVAAEQRPTRTGPAEIFHPQSSEIPDAAVPLPDRATGPLSETFTILVVDDDAVNRQVLVNQLSLHDYRVVEAVDGEDALRLVESQRPDLVLLDVMMPRMSGYDVCRTLRENLPPSQMPVIYLTARAQVVDVVTGFESGGNDFLTKPVTRSELLVRVRTHLELLDATRNLEQKVADRTEELRVANVELERIASLDDLTRIPNRRSLDAAIERQWADHARREATIGFILFDIDDFKLFNDRYGHQRGDEALIAVAQAAAGVLRRPNDLVARYGGEEFAALLANTTPEGAEAVARSILETVRDLGIEHAAGSASDRVTVSLGVVTMVPSPSGDPHTMIERADRVLYAAKKAGRNRLVVDA